jgi:hypothetical protein
MRQFECLRCKLQGNIKGIDAAGHGSGPGKGASLAEILFLDFKIVGA